MTTSSSISNARLRVYQDWVRTWLRTSTPSSKGFLKEASVDISIMAYLLQDSNLGLLSDLSLLHQVIASFQQRFRDGQIVLGGSWPPSSEVTNLLSECYDPRVECTCEGVLPSPSTTNVTSITCVSIEKMRSAQDDVIERHLEWNGRGLFTVEKLQAAVEELTFCNFGINETLTNCLGTSFTSIPCISAPDRRPSARCDSDPDVFNNLFPTFENIKLCADAKYFHAMACGGTLVDQGLLYAIADAGNDVLIGDYCEAATEEGLHLLQQIGAAAVAFLKACNLAGLVNDWQLDVLVAAHIQFRVLGYYRNHAVAKLPAGLYGSRMTGIAIHRHIDIANAVGVVAASLATGEQLNESEYMQLSYGTTLINDLVDFRSDAMRKQRENPVLRGVQGSICEYLRQQVLDCLINVRTLIESKRLLAMVTMAFCNWCVMASHHKLHEVYHGAVQNTTLKQPCKYHGLEEQYELLLNVLRPYGSIGSAGPHLGMKRRDLDQLYSHYKQTPETHRAWLADMVRILMQPTTFRRIVDVVHYPWVGDIGEAEYCP
ncbi:hypothetical protein BDV38DRAFT_290524 [Aspergillus pseudotamarii]|uniref:Uncharacterized protein n=1 Tax=Aspergillus pseudotamarii TaxID=132259 RepID=A0A5N6T1W8_ASPPS|nr:uncharacterized protein BDV38DRAFT_290524 [Aspergillus pseudotamarii]KAE8140283.1 hypothetical protein BDV38DRAFT_290524 [Aspergillus pseudotamarii]